MINIQKQPVHHSSLIIYNGTHIIKQQWEDELELTAYPFTSSIRLDQVQQTLTVTTVWGDIIPPNSVEIEKEIKEKILKHHE